jgi:lipopolysaccharide/colanic/teichoic acid biosynthesis glycosyltransferase
VKRAFDVLASCIGLFLLLPLCAAIAVAIKLDSSGPILFRQERVGRRGRTFKIHKFRTMHCGAGLPGPQITVANDLRVTKVGSILRTYKLDELPQLVDVLRGRMSLVGPRPEVPKYVGRYPAHMRDIVLSVRPGMTDPTSIDYRNEGDLLVQGEDPERTYLEHVLPKKLESYVRYIQTRTFLGDVRIIFRTIGVLMVRRH